MSYGLNMKQVKFVGSALKSLREFPEQARRDSGRQLSQLQRGKQPGDFKPMPSIGRGVEEIRIFDEAGAFRVIYTARMVDAIYVLHAFQKKTASTSKLDIEIARSRWAGINRGLK